MIQLRFAAFALAACSVTGVGCQRQTAPSEAAHPATPVTQPQTVQASSSSVWVSSNLIQAGKAIASALNEPFDAPYPVTLSTPPGATKTLTTCSDYLPVEHSIYSAGSALDFQSLRAAGARCDALNLLRSAKLTQVPSSPAFSFVNIRTKSLPPQLALNISNEQIARADAIAGHQGSILDLDPSVMLSKQAQDTATLNTKNWSESLTLLAQGDILANGQNDLIVRRDATVTHGTYTSATIFLLSWVPSSQRLTLVRELP